jgi:hypothetical protein
VLRYTGEAIVNTAGGVMMFSGVTSGSNDWVPAGIMLMLTF